MDCDGPKHVLIHDLDGTLIGQGAGSSIIARAEMMNEYRADSSQFAWYNIPSKMLNDPAPLNDLSDPGWDTSALGIPVSMDALYRRRLSEGDESANTSFVDFSKASPPHDIVYATSNLDDGSVRSVTRAELHAKRRASDSARRLSGASATASSWINRMVFYTGDERQLIAADQAGIFQCSADMAFYDPTCRAKRKTHAEVAYAGYGTYRAGCTLSTQFNAWVCPAANSPPHARLIIESRDEDHTSRSIVPVALASGGYVDLLNGGWDHMEPDACGGYNCMKRLTTFHATVAVNRSYDLAFTGTNPRDLRLMMPHGAGQLGDATMEATRIVVSIYYSNPETLQVFYDGTFVPSLESHMKARNSYNTSMRKPTTDDPCGSNAYAGWERKIYVTLCGGIPGLEIRTVRKVQLSFGIELSTEDFFDSHYMTRNLASLFGIPPERMRIPKIVAGSLNLDLDVQEPDLCDAVPTCGLHGSCSEGKCICEEGWATPAHCEPGSECECSTQVGCDSTCLFCSTGFDRWNNGANDGEMNLNNVSCLICDSSLPYMLEDGTCATACPAGQLVSMAGPRGHGMQRICRSCHETCASCSGPNADQCTSCDDIGVNAFLHNGQCVLKCPENHYADQARVCHPCAASCKTCAGPGGHECTACRPNSCTRSGMCPPAVLPVFVRDYRGPMGGEYRQPLGECVNSCPTGFYVDSKGACAECHAACQQCKGPTGADCIDPTRNTPFTDADCAVGAFRAGRECRLACRAGMYQYTTTRGDCAFCPSYDCKMCDPANPTQCLSCKTYTSPFVFKLSAPDGVSEFPSALDVFAKAANKSSTYSTYVPKRPWIRPVLRNGSCSEACSAGEYSKPDLSCATCHSSCSACKGPGADMCLSCDSSSTLPHWHLSQCIAACPAGFVANSTGHCILCHHTCGACAVGANASQCLTCISNDRVTLLKPLLDLNGTDPETVPTPCLDHCPIGQYEDPSAASCKACSEGCASCYAGGCIQCVSGLQLTNGACVPIQRPNNTQTDNLMADTASNVRTMASSGSLDSGYPVASLGLVEPRVPVAAVEPVRPVGLDEIQLIVITGNCPPPPPPLPPLPPNMPPSPPRNPVPVLGAPLAPPFPPYSPPPSPPPPLPPDAPPAVGAPLGGLLHLTFNGETASVELSAFRAVCADGPGGSSLDLASQAVSNALTSLNVISPTGIYVNGTSSIDYGGNRVTLEFTVYFHTGQLIQPPLNMGDMPLLEIGTSRAAGIVQTSVSVVQEGTAPEGFVYPEQAIRLYADASVIASLTGGMTLTFRNETTAPFHPNAGAAVVREALTDLEAIGTVEVFKSDLTDVNGTFVGIEYKVRYYRDGDPPHMGPQPTLLIDSSNLAVPSGGRRRLLGISVGVAVTAAGSSPFDGIVEADPPVVEDDLAAPTNDTSANAITFVAPVHICGNGIRSTAEICDDNNTQSSDGCDSLCRVEAGFTCTSSTEGNGGSGVGGLDTCVPICGDGKKMSWANEGCDDNNTIAGDGCSATCTVEPGYACTGGNAIRPDTCATVCGDGFRAGAESCDDGNLVSYDGCSGDCTTIEAGFTCSGGTPTSIDACQPCHAACATCSGNTSSDCSTCATTHPFANFVSAPGECVASCTPLGKYADSSLVCRSCEESCLTCSGASSSDCLSCPPSTLLDSGTCVSECPLDGKFADVFGSTSLCRECSSSCKQCTGSSSSDCSACPSTGTKYFDLGSCLATCPDGKYADDSANSCASCDASCATCSGAARTECLSCRTGGTYSSSQKTCTFACPSNQYLVPGTSSTCAACDASCLTCASSATTCITCDTTGSTPSFHNSACIASCPDGYYADSNYLCQTCHRYAATD